MSPYVTSAIIGGAIMFALQVAGLGFSADHETAHDETGGHEADGARPQMAIIALQ